MDYLNNLDIFEVDKVDYDSYFYRLPKNEIMKTTPQEGLVAYKDIKEEGELICGILSEQIMAMPANRYFIFNFIVTGLFPISFTKLGGCVTFLIFALICVISIFRLHLLGNMVELL